MVSGSLTRRGFVGAAGASLLASTSAGLRAATKPAMARVILDNDWSGDPDGLFQLAQHVLSSAIDIPLVVGSHLPGNMSWRNSDATATEGAAKASELLQLMQLQDRFPVLAGSEVEIPSRDDWRPSPATDAIIHEAMREDTGAQFIYASGAGLTELALAWLAEPRIGTKTRLVWIGGREHEGLAYPPPNADALEYNFSIDPIAAQVIFNESDIEIWQVPRSSYRQMLFSYAELRELARSGPIGTYLKGEIDRIDEMVGNIPTGMSFPRTETYILGDSPLVTLTALHGFFQHDPSSSEYVAMPTPRLTANGEYETNPDGRPMRVYTSLDTRLTFADMVAKIREADAALTQ